MQALQNLGIDGWSVLLYLVNVGLLLLVLTKFLYRPVLKYLDERRETIKRNITEAEVIKSNFQSELVKQEQKTKELVQKLELDVKNAGKEAELKSRQLLAEGEKRKEEILTDAKKQAEEMKSQVHKDAEKEILFRMEKALTIVLRDKVSKEVIDESVKASWKEVSEKL